MKKLQNYFILLFSISFFLLSCEKEDVFLEKKQPTLKTVSKNNAKNIFGKFQKKQKKLLAKNSNKQLKITPHWNSFNQKSLDFTDALLSNVKAEINVNLNFDIRLIFIEINNEFTKAIESRDIEEQNEDGTINKGKVYFHTFTGKYITGYIIENSKVVKKLVPKKNVNKANMFSLFMFYQECDENLQEGNFCDDVLQGIELSFESNNSGGNAYYQFIYESNNEEESGGNNGEGGGDEGGNGPTNEDPPVVCGEGYTLDNNGNCVVESVLEAPELLIEDMENYLRCFDTTKSAQLTIYIDQPIANQSDAWTTGDGKAGHAFINLTQGNLTRSWGLYPSGTAGPYSPDDPHAFGNNMNDEFDVSITITINQSSLFNIVEDARNYNINYDLNTNNCTDYVIQTAQLAGIALPDPQSTWTNGGGSNPGAFGQAIRTMTLVNGMTRNNTGGNAGNNTTPINCN